MASPLKLSVLDQSPIPSGWTPAGAVRATVALAQACDQLGYTRYWLAEHHNTGALAGTAPEVLIPVVASHTQHLRVGSGGVMLSHYSSLKVAESFRVLEALFPSRIDLGIGRAPGSDHLTANALALGPGALSIEHFPEQIRDVIGYLHDQLPESHPFVRVHANPRGPTAPELWLLGSSGYSAAYAAHFGLAFSYAHFINPLGGPEMVAGYRERFRVSGLSEAPRANVGVSVLCAESDAAADRIAHSTDLWRLRRDMGQQGPIPSLAEALAYPFSDAERAHIAQNRRKAIIGGPAKVREEMLALAARYGVGELVVVTICHAFEDRVRSYELLAEAFQLERPNTGAETAGVR